MRNIFRFWEPGFLGGGGTEGLDLGGSRERATAAMDREEEKRREESAREETTMRS